MMEENNNLIGQENEQTAVENTESCAACVNLPEEIKKFNWGAFFLSWVWGLGNNSYITLFAFLVYGASALLQSFGTMLPLCLAFNIYCGIMGNEWAWKNKVWESTNDFNRIQKRWTIAGVLFFVITRILAVTTIILIIVGMFHLLLPNGSINKGQDWATVCKKGFTKFVKYSVETSLEGTNISKIGNSNELAREIASGFNTVSLGNIVPISSNGKFILKVYKDGDCTLLKKNCYIELNSTKSGKDFMKFYIDENKKLTPVE